DQADEEEQGKEQEQAKAPTKTKERKEPEQSKSAEPKTDGDGDGDGKASGKVLSPVVRKLIAEHDLDPSVIEGTGQGGRITRADVLAYIDQGQKDSKEKAPSKADKKEAPKEAKEREREPERAAPRPASTKAGADDETVAFSNIRRRTAEHMVRSKSVSAHVLTAVEADFENVEKVRQAAQREFKEREGFSLTYLPFIARAVIDAIEDFPHVNASVGDD